MLYIIKLFPNSLHSSIAHLLEVLYSYGTCYIVHGSITQLSDLLYSPGILTQALFV